jgi:hypothetical protein
MRAPEPPPLAEDIEALLRRLRLPHIRRAAPEVIATARAQRWEPAEVLQSLLSEELAGQERSSLATRRAAAALAGATVDRLLHHAHVCAISAQFQWPPARSSRVRHRAGTVGP